MLEEKKEDLANRQNRSRRRKGGGDYRAYVLIAAGAAVLIGSAVFGGLHLKNRETAKRAGDRGGRRADSGFP